ncbi:hypothetical protein RKD18_006083 [Streptomyces phaeoluteigriseus]
MLSFDQASQKPQPAAGRRSGLLEGRPHRATNVVHQVVAAEWITVQVRFWRA